jgi:hypothetical protein
MATDESLIAIVHELGQAMNGRPELVSAALPRLESILATAADPQLVGECVHALGYAWDARATALILMYVPVDHPDEEVRLELAQAVHQDTDEPGPLRDAAITALVRLTTDTVADVRDWACFGLAQMEADTPAVRDALAARLEDDDVDTRCEALRSLARLGDDRAVVRLLRRLGEDDDALWTLELEAAVFVADPRLHPDLLLLAAEWEGDDGPLMEPLARAMARCHPGASGQAAEVERDVVDRIRQLSPVPVAISLTGTWPHTRLTVQVPSGAVFTHDLWIDGWSAEDPWTLRAAQVGLAVRSLAAPADPGESVA